MALSKKKREALKMKYGGHCSYCGILLGSRWHADHLESVGRISHYHPSLGKHIATGKMDRPENDHEANLMPACIPCNIDKGAMSLEHWRRSLEHKPEVLLRDYATYKHAHRFGLVAQIKVKVVFHFEAYQPRRRLFSRK